jgi:hypothetical protein
MSTAKRIGRPPNQPSKSHPPEAWGSNAAIDEVQKTFDALELTEVDPGVRYALQRWIWRADKYSWGRGDIILAMRCIVESEANGPEALLNPILGAVHGQCRPEWTCKGLDFVAAFDGIDLRELLKSMRDLRCFRPDEITNYLTTAIRDRLWDIFGADAAPSADVRRKPKRFKRARGRLPSERPWESAPLMHQAV